MQVVPDGFRENPVAFRKESPREYAYARQAEILAAVVLHPLNGEQVVFVTRSEMERVYDSAGLWPLNDFGLWDNNTLVVAQYDPDLTVTRSDDLTDLWRDFYHAGTREDAAVVSAMQDFIQQMNPLFDDARSVTGNTIRGATLPGDVRLA